MQESKQNNIIQPKKLAQKSGEICFSWPVDSFERLSSALYSTTGEVRVLIDVSTDFEQRCLLKTRIETILQLECQTSFEPIDFKVSKMVTYCTVVKESQLAEAEQSFEPVLIDEGYLDIKQVIEDELILSIPIVSNKPLDELNQTMCFGELDEEEQEKVKENPFSVLKNLKNT